MFKSDIYISRLENVAQGIRQGRTISTEDFYNIVVDVPPFHDQRAIADYLDTETARIDALIAKKRRMIELLNERSLKFARSAVALGHQYSDPLHVGGTTSVPAGVTPLKLTWVATFGGGTTPAADNPSYYGGSVPWVLTGDLNDGDLFETSRLVTDDALNAYSSLRLHPVGTVVVAMYGATIGKLSVLRTAATVNQACCAISPGACLLAEYLFLYLRAFREELVDLGRGSGQPNISQETLRDLRLPMPDTAAQREVVAAIANADRTRGHASTALAKQVDLLQEHRQALITAAVTGELEVPEVAA